MIIESPPESPRQLSEFDMVDDESMSISGEHQSLESMPDELLFQIFQHLEDTDLQTMTRISPQFRRLASDYQLWRYHRLVRNPAILNTRLNDNVRPDREMLIHRNILPGINRFQVERGSYLNGPNQPYLHQMQSRLSRFMRHQMLQQGLRQRPDAEDLQNRGVLTPKSARISSALVPRCEQLRRALQQAVLSRKLQRRKTMADMKSEGLLKNTAVAPSIAAAHNQLEKHFQDRNVSEKIRTRPTPQFLRNQNVLRGDEDENGMIVTTATATEIEEDDTRGDLLAHFYLTTKGPLITNRLEARPSLAEMERTKILEVRDVAQRICPSVRPKIRHFEEKSQASRP